MVVTRKSVMSTTIINSNHFVSPRFLVYFVSCNHISPQSKTVELIHWQKYLIYESMLNMLQSTTENTSPKQDVGWIRRIHVFLWLFSPTFLPNIMSMTKSQNNPTQIYWRCWQTFDPAIRAMPTDSFRFCPPERFFESACLFSFSRNTSIIRLTSAVKFDGAQPFSWVKKHEDWH